MTEQEWLECRDPEKMLEFLRGSAKTPENLERKLRLFGAACCRHIRLLLCDKRSRKAIEMAERFADGLVSGGALDRARRVAGSAGMLRAVEDSRATSAWMAPLMITDRRFYGWDSVIATMRALEHAGVRVTERDFQCTAVKDIIGNPFRPITFDPAWRTPTVVQLARSLYEERRFEEMPVLGDAVEEAGCQDAVVLGHCRGPGPHLRGCRLLDRLLRKE